MKMTLKVLLVGISMIILNSCDTDDSVGKPVSGSINKIMSLGASRVEGNRPDFESFRYELWKDLIENDWTFDFVGTQSDNASYPPFNNNDFDVDHEGRGGWTSEEILNGLTNWLSETGSPDIVLFSSPGGNDALQDLPYNEAISNISSIIDALQTNNPNITIIIEQMAPGRSDIMTEELSTYLNLLHEEVVTMASEYSTSTSELIVVDMYTDFTDEMLADEVHYNEAGAVFIADRYYDVLADALE